MTNGNDKIDADGTWTHSHGLTKRELFAAMAMQGLVLYRSKDGQEPTSDVIATWSVQTADALIEALNDTKEKP